MILVAATAPAIVVMRNESLWPEFPWPKSWGTVEDSYTFFNQIRWTSYSFSFFFAAWSLAWLLLRLRRPRPRLRRLMRQPGMVACTASAVVLGIRLINHLSIAGLIACHYGGADAWGYLDDITTQDEMPFVPSQIGCAVAAAWAVQALGGCWRPERSWIDRMGRVLGWYWLAMIPFSWFHSAPGV
jgi:hypothetical protein